jgi:hypothetical protein
VVREFAYYRADHYPITGQAFVDDPGWQRRRLYSLFFARFTGAFLALGHSHKVFSRLDVKLFGSLVADDDSFFAALAAVALIGCAGDHLFDSWQFCWQLLPARMLARGFKGQS